MGDDDISIAGPNLYRVTYTMSDNKDYQKLIVARDAAEVENFYSEFKTIELIETDISMKIFASCLEKR